MRKALLAPLFALAVSVAAPASADLPPPDGQKFVDFAFQVEGLAQFSEYVLLAYPYSTSNGRPTTELMKLDDGKPATLGRRSGLPKLYAMKKSAYEKWLESYKPDTEATNDPALETLFSSDQVVACNAAVQPSHVLPKEDSRDTVVQAFRAKTIDEKTCELEPASAAPTPPTKVASSEPAKPVAQSEPASSTPPPAKGGCAGCATVPNDAPEGATLFGLFALALSGTWLRSRRRTSLR